MIGRFLILIVALAATAGSAAAPSPILTTPEARDVLSYAEPAAARVTNVALDLVTDFARHRMSGTATLDILAAPGADHILLDDRGLVIASVRDGHGRRLRWSVGSDDPEKGAPLTVALGGARRIVIRYRSSADASALQWLMPAQTAGKRQPFLFSQGEPTNNRSWIPTQDSPGIRQTWSARIVVPAALTAVMSGERLSARGERAAPGQRAFRFRMTHPVPPYLIALAVGDLAFRSLGSRTGVWAEPATLGRAAAELSDTEKMVDAAEALYGPYRWGRYDVLVLPPSFPFGGMENPTLTFATPTILTGDKSNVDVIAHELAHSWSGNLVTNATWSDSWLNEGFTTYFENRIVERLYGSERAATQADLQWDDLQRDLKGAGGPASPDTRLHGDPSGSFGEIDYNKGSTFLRTIERAVGRARWDAYLRSYFDRYAFQPQTTAGFLADLRLHLIQGDASLEQQLQLDRWANQPGLPDNAVHVRSATLARVNTQLASIVAGAPVAATDTHSWTTQEWLRFLNGLPRVLPRARLDELDATLHLSVSPNAYIRCAWLRLAIANRYDPAIPALRQHLMSVGRMLLILPLYQGLKDQGDWGMRIARPIYSDARPTYHPIAAARIDRVLNAAPSASTS